MRIVVAYDIATVNRQDRRRLRRVANICSGFGIRIQKSLFDCALSYQEVSLLLHKLESVIDPKRDNILIVRVFDIQRLSPDFGRVLEMRSETNLSAEVWIV